jgi:hypothetical protein
MPDEPKPRITLLYLGCRENERGKPLQHLWYDLTGIDNDGEPLAEESARHQYYGSKKKGHTTKNIAFAQPRAIYSFERSEGGIYGSTGKYQGRPTPKPYSDDPNADPVEVVPESEWTDGIKNIVAYSRFLAQELMGVKVVVRVVRTTNHFLACYGSGRLDFNLTRLGRKWFEQGITEDVDRLLIHEFGHEYSADHLSAE